MKEITVTFHNGEVKIETSGFQGGACIEAVKGLKDKLGIVTDTQHKPEFHQLGVGASQIAQQKGGA